MSRAHKKAFPFVSGCGLCLLNFILFCLEVQLGCIGNLPGEAEVYQPLAAGRQGGWS